MELWRKWGTLWYAPPDATHFTLCNGTLAGNLNGNFFQALDVSHTVQEGHEDLKSWLKSPVESSHALDNPSLLLWHKLDYLLSLEEQQMLVDVRN